MNPESNGCMRRYCGGGKALRQWDLQTVFPNVTHTLYYVSSSQLQLLGPMSFQTLGHHSRSDKGDLEGGWVLATSEDTRFPTWYSYLFDRGPLASWMLFGCCTLVGLINIFSTLLTLAETTNLTFSDTVVESNAILLSTSLLISLFWHVHSSQCQSTEEQIQARNEPSSCVIGSFIIMLLSPSIACLPLLVISWFPGHGTSSSGTSGIPLVLSWIVVNAIAALPRLYPGQIGRQVQKQNNPSEGYALLRERTEDCDIYEIWDETDGPTFLPQQPAPVLRDIFEWPLDKEIKAASTFTPDVSWKDAIESPAALRELVCWAISVPGESLPPSVASELLDVAATSVGVHLDGMGSWNQDTQYTYLMSRMCDRLAEIFRQADPSAVPEHAVNVFLLVDRLEQFDGVDVTVLGAGSGYIPIEELLGIVRCLKSRSTSLLGC